MMVKPPRNEAITKALAIVMDSIGDENGSQLVYKDRAKLESAALDTLANAENALEVAKSHIFKDIDQHIAYIRSCRNRATPIHQLPAEVFAIIIEIVLTRDYSARVDERRMMQLMTVGRIWHDVIINSPQLWTTIRSGYPLDIAELFIERSKALPLSLTGRTDTSRSDDLGPTNTKFETLLELGTRNSSRVSSIDVTIGGGSRRTLQRFLGCPTTRLEKLRVSTPEYGDPECLKFALSEGSPLKELSLSYMGLLDWDSRRLSGLRVLNLQNLDVGPSINQILRILSISPFLQELRLRSMDPPAIVPTTRSEERDRGEGLIELPHLQTIDIQSLPLLYCPSILSRIRPWFCRNVYIHNGGVDDVNDTRWDELWRERGHTMAALLQLSQPSPLSPDDDWALFIEIGRGSVGIRNALPEEYIGKSTLSFRYGDGCRAIEVLGEFFSGLDFQIRPVSLQIAASPIWETRQPNLLQWSSVLGTLQVLGIHLVRAVYRLLGEKWVMQDGTVTWACPRLSHVDLSYCYNEYREDNPEVDGVALLLAVQKRWAGDHGIPAVPQPSSFRVSCGYATVPSIQSKAETIKSIIPCFYLM